MAKFVNALKDAQEFSFDASLAPKPALIRNQVRIPIGTQMGDVFTFHGLLDGKEHLAIGLGAWSGKKQPLVRLHSECLTGDVFGSGKCDCGEQLQESLRKIGKEGGFILYLRQEGRGIGLYNKIDAYALQAQGHDTYEANELLGLPYDARNYAVAAQMLKALGANEIRLLSNNPDKALQLRALGIRVPAQIGTGVFLKKTNKNYLQAKVDVTGHLINLKDSDTSSDCSL